MSTNTSANANTNASIDAAKAISKGEMPSNQTINNVLDKANTTLENEKQRNPKLNEQGKDVADKIQNVINAAQDHLNEKNADEKLQKFVQHTKETAKDAKNTGQSAVANSDSSTSDLTSALKQLFKLLATSGEFRITLVSSIKWAQATFWGVTNDGSQAPSKEAVKDALSGNAASGDAAKQQEQAWNDFVKMMKTIGSHPDYQAAIQGIFEFVDDVADADKIKELHPGQNDNTANMIQHARAILEELAGGMSTEPLVEQIRTLKSYIKNDQRLSRWWTDALEYLRRVMKDPSLLENDSEVEKGKGIVKQGVNLVQEYKDHHQTQKLMDLVQSFLSAIKNDPTNARLGAALKDLGSVVIKEENGQKTVDVDAIAQMRELLMPIVLDQLNRIPLPTIQGSDEKMDYKFDNIVFSGRDIVPDHMRIKYDNDMDFNVKDLRVQKADQTMRITISNINVYLTDVKFWFKRHHFPKIEDEGTADVSVGGDGAEIIIRAKMSANAPYFTTSKVECNIEKLKIKIVESAKHETLLKMATTLWAGTVRRKVEDAVEEKLMQAMKNVEVQINKLIEKLKGAVSSDNAPTPVAVIKAIVGGTDKAQSSSA